MKKIRVIVKDRNTLMLDEDAKAGDYISLNELNDKEVMASLLNATKEVTKKLNITDYRTVINTGKGAGQEVFHIHLHILAGRPLKWPPG